MFSELSVPMQYLSTAILHLLRGIHAIVPNWGISIILLALIIRILLFPFSQRAARSQHRFTSIQKRIAPDMAKIKKELKGAEQSEAILALYKANGISPFTGMKPLLILLIQLPVFVSLYHVLKNVSELQTASFLWMDSLALPDQIMPFLMTFATFISMKVSPAPSADRQAAITQNILMAIMAVSFLILFYKFPAGMVMYWTCANLFALLQTKLFKVKGAAT